MPAAGSTQDFIMFRDAMTEVERLVDVQGNIPIMDHILTTIREGIICKLKLLIELDMDTSESNAIEELERLAALKQKTALQARSFLNQGHIPYLAGGVKPEDEQMLYKMINSKVDFIKKGSFNRLVCGSNIEPMAALERLTEVQKILISKDLNDILESKFKEIVYTPRPKASPRNDRHAPFAQSNTVSSANVMASQKQKSLESNLLIDFEDSKTTAKLASSPLSWIQETEPSTQDR